VWLRRATESTDRKQGFTRRVLHRGIQLIDLPTDHQRDELRLGCRSENTTSDRLSIPKHHIAIADAADFFQKMADVDDADSLLTQTANGVKQTLHVRPRQGAGRLVKHNYLRLANQCASNFHNLLHTGGKAIHRRLERQVGMPQPF